MFHVGQKLDDTYFYFLALNLCRFNDFSVKPECELLGTPLKCDGQGRKLVLPKLGLLKFLSSQSAEIQNRALT